MEKFEAGIVNALNLLATIPVKGRDVKAMALAMQHLENALEDIHKNGEKEVNDG